MRLGLLIIALLLASLLLALWLFASWFEWSMADFDCVDGYWACRRNIVVPTLLRVVPAVMLWALAVWPLVREWKRD